MPFDKYATSKRARISLQLDEPEELFQESAEKDRYLITYADLITLLLGLFILLYTASNLDIQKYEKMLGAFSDVFGTSAKINISNPQEPLILTPIDRLKIEMNQLISESEFSNSIRMEENERGIVIHILENIVFTPGSAELKNTSKIVLHRIANIIKKLPNDIRVEGHTDNIPINTPTFPSNWHLSVARALNTAYYLINNEGVPPDRVSIVGNAEYKPIESNETAYGRALNRRVDIVIIK
ncbi:MAG: OmpA family protein [Ignavibacterium sp.]|nr:OmpA family protein [Ignavibacterium sp.]